MKAVPNRPRAPIRVSAPEAIGRRIAHPRRPAAGRRRSSGAKKRRSPQYGFLPQGPRYRRQRRGVACASLGRCVVPTDRPVHTGAPPHHCAAARLLARSVPAHDLPGHSRSFAFWRSDRRRRGSGYRMGREFEVRPIMFTFEEVRRWWRTADGREAGVVQLSPPPHVRRR